MARGAGADLPRAPSEADARSAGAVAADSKARPSLVRVDVAEGWVGRVARSPSGAFVLCGDRGDRGACPSVSVVTVDEGPRSPRNAGASLERSWRSSAP